MDGLNVGFACIGCFIMSEYCCDLSLAAKII